MAESIEFLSYAVRPKVVAKYLGLLSIMLSILTTVPLFVSLGFSEFTISQRYFIQIVVLLVLGLSSLRIETNDDLQTNEALTISALAFLLTPLIATFPLMGSGLSFVDSWFEAVSAITTTGLSTVVDIDQMPQTFLFARAWMQWYGGLGIVVLSVALLMGHNIAIKRLIGSGGESMVTSNRQYARRVLFIYLALTVVGTLILWWTLQDLFIATTHTLSAISTGGFSPLTNGVADIPDWVGRFSIVMFSFLGALPLVLYYRMFRGSWYEVIKDPEFRILLLLIFSISVVLSISIQNDLGIPWGEAVGHGAFLSMSAQTTAGFSALDLAQLGSGSLGLLMLSMFIGGGVGSTAGGIKILRLIILVRLVQLLLRRSALPSHAVAEPRIGDKVIDENEITRALLLIILFIGVIALSWLVFLYYGYSPLHALFEVVSASATVGLSSGVTSTELPILLKLVLAIDMLLGRLEIIALLIILYPPTWIGKRKE